MALLRTIALCAACIPTLSCGGYYFVGFVSNPGGTSTMTGVVVAVSGGFVTDLTTMTPYTAVTFSNSERQTKLTFCGNQQMLFPIDQTVRVEYTVGPVCSVLTRVVNVDDAATASALIRPKLFQSHS